MSIKEVRESQEDFLMKLIKNPANEQLLIQEHGKWPYLKSSISDSFYHFEAEVTKKFLMDHLKSLSHTYCVPWEK